jgi:rifampicin phosphotransferase
VRQTSFGWAAMAALCLLPIAIASPAAAIPSPELIIGSAASLSQIGALIAATFGGGALLAGSKAGRASRALRITLMVFAVLIAALSAALAVVWSAAVSERQARLEATLVRPARQPGQDIADNSVKELSFQEQERHPLGVATAEAARVIKEGADDPSLVVVDARNDAEVETGGLAAPRIVRLSDFRTDDPQLKGKRFIFYCHNGNRSFESCEVASAKGVDCRFIVGGLEKWVVEQRQMSGLQARSLADLRAIPDYPGRGRLLDTAEVKSLIETRQAHIIDVRYPGDFDRQHMPNAINIPLRRMVKSEVEAALAPLDKTRPAVLPCYDRRSCFFADVMGLNLSRAGFEVAGRYTLPFEYFIPSPRPPHVDAWIAEQNKSYWQRARGGLAGLLVWGAGQIGLAWTLLLLAALSRAAVWPFTAKSERDQIVARATADEIAALKQRLRDDPVRLRRAVFAHAARHNLTPVRNLTGLLFLPLLALATLAAGDAAVVQPTRWLWIADLAKPDATVALPLLVAMSLTLYCVAVFARTPRQQVITALIGVPLLTIMTVPLPAAASLYVLASTVLLVAQRLWVIGVPRRMLTLVRSVIRNLGERRLGGAVPLGPKIDAAVVGNKAARLAALMADGFPVPAALVLDQNAVARLLNCPAEERLKQTDQMARALGGKAFAVRSSAVAEDSATASFAGVFESMLHVTRDKLGEAIAQVAASFLAARARAYADDAGQIAGGNIIIQRMVEPDIAGVLFTRAPDAPGQMLVEFIQGTADDLASGRRTPRSVRFGRLTHSPIGEAVAVDFAPLLKLGAQIAHMFGAAQDIEWARADGRFYILQARDIVTDATERNALAQAEQLLAIASRTLGAAAGAAGSSIRRETVVFRSSPMAELLPRPTTLSLSLVNALWAAGGSIDHAARRLGLTYDAAEDSPQLFQRINGRLIADATIEASHALRMTARDRARLLKSAAAISDDVRVGLCEVAAQEALLSVVELPRLSQADLMALWQRTLARFLTEVHPLAETANILAGLMIEGRSDGLANGLGAGAAAQRPAWHGAMLSAAALSERERPDAWRRVAGHRSNLDYELAHPRWAEIPSAVDAFVLTLQARPGNSAERSALLPGSLEALTLLKEDAKHEMLRTYALLRRLLLEIDRRAGLGGHIFELTLVEVAALLPERGTSIHVVARERRHAMQRLLTEPPPPTVVTAADLERIGTHGFAATNTTNPSPQTPATGRCKGRGVRVSGRVETSGRVYVATREQAEAGLPLDEFRDRDILVTPLVHPDWLAVVLRSGGVVADTGGWLSHMAIVAREHGVAMIVGVPNAGQFRTGDRVRLMPDGKVLAEPDAIARLALVGQP